MKVIVPIGVDCGIAEFCKKNNLRNFSLPFDWTVTYNGVSKCIEDEFNNFIPSEDRFNIYDMYFCHDFTSDTFANDIIKYDRRNQRLINILKTSNDEIIFFRKGHAYHHHTEHNEKYKNITSDIEDAEKLNCIISTKYPNLNYKIIVVLVCGVCFDSTITYKNTTDKIEIHNIATPKVDDALFEKCVRSIFNI